METNVQRLASKVEIDFEWELLTVIKQKWINIYWRQVEHVIAAKANVNFCWNSKEDCGGGEGGQVAWGFLYSFTSLFAVSAKYLLLRLCPPFFSVSENWSERLDLALTETHINSGWSV